MNAHQRKIQRDDRARELAEVAELRATATAEADRLRAELADVRAAYANERGVTGTLRFEVARLERLVVLAGEMHSSAGRLVELQRSGLAELRGRYDETTKALANAEQVIARMLGEDRDAASLRRRLARKTDELAEAHRQIRELRARVRAERPLVDYQREEVPRG
jgi:chemotaxis protein histidine kinase CheA